MLSFDTNILVYAADRTAGVRHTTSAHLLTAAVSVEAALNQQSVIEFLRVTTRKQKQPLADASKIVQAWLSNFALMTTPPTIVEDTLSILKSHRLEIWDAHMLAICASYGCDVLLSEDMTDGALYGRVRVLNPFNPKNASAIAEILLP